MAFAPKPGSPIDFDTAIRKASMPMRCPSAVLSMRGSMTGQRAVVILVGTPFHGAVQPQLSYSIESGTM